MGSAGLKLQGTETDSVSVMLYPNEAAAKLAGSALVFIGLQMNRESPWEIIGYPGAKAIRAKFIRCKPRTYTIHGAVITDIEATAKTGMGSIMALNAMKTGYQITVGNILLHDGGMAIVENVVAHLVGGNTGPVWGFEIQMRDMGTT